MQTTYVLAIAIVIILLLLFVIKSYLLDRSTTSFYTHTNFGSFDASKDIEPFDKKVKFNDLIEVREI